MELKKQEEQAFRNLEQALNEYEELVNNKGEPTLESVPNTNNSTVRTIRIYLQERKVTFNHINEENQAYEEIILTPGHNINLFYKRKPIKQYQWYRSEPHHPKPWLSLPND
ncbi:hypothetical protein [Halalkalibacter urbisdiaboli]|uniref:hypothetical protein n=1 Tax=Halalkalibacter urbisdiaboli TaxID=1960589 RepID=UPI000B43B2CA|nr:hypothetical protein [Halalkalibacter urbisdiaboli]